MKVRLDKVETFAEIPFLRPRWPLEKVKVNSKSKADMRYNTWDEAGAGMRRALFFLISFLVFYEYISTFHQHSKYKTIFLQTFSQRILHSQWGSHFRMGIRQFFIFLPVIFINICWMGFVNPQTPLPPLPTPQPVYRRYPDNHVWTCQYVLDSNLVPCTWSQGCWEFRWKLAYEHTLSKWIRTQKVTASRSSHLLRIHNNVHFVADTYGRTHTHTSCQHKTVQLHRNGVKTKQNTSTSDIPSHM